MSSETLRGVAIYLGGEEDSDGSTKGDLNSRALAQRRGREGEGMGAGGL